MNKNREKERKEKEEQKEIKTETLIIIYLDDIFARFHLRTELSIILCCHGNGIGLLDLREVDDTSLCGQLAKNFRKSVDCNPTTQTEAEIQKLLRCSIKLIWHSIIIHVFNT